MPKKKLTFMEELVLAQTGRRMKNVNLLLGGGRTIHRPERYEDKTLMKKKRHRQKHDEEHEEPSKRKKQASSPGDSPTKVKSPRSYTNSKFIEASKDDRPLNVTDAEGEHPIGKIKAR